MTRAERPGRHAPPWRVSSALALAIPLAFASYNAVLRGNDWWLAIALTSTIVLGAAAATRGLLETTPRVRLIRALPTAAAAFAALVTVSIGSVAGTTFFGLPTFDTFRALFDLGAEGVGSLAAQEAPALADPGVILLFSAGSAVAALLCDLVAVALRRPALTGLLLVPVAVVPAFIVPLDDVSWVIVAAISWLLVLAASRPGRGRRGWDVVAVLAASIAAALVAAVVLPLPSAREITGSGPGNSIRSGVNPVVTLGEDLRREETITALRYSSRSGKGHYFRLTALDSLTEEGWSVADPPELGDGPDEAPAPPGLSPDVLREREVTPVSVDSLGGGWVPVPYPAVSVDGLRANAVWDTRAQALRTEGRSVRGEQYEVESMLLRPTPQQLQDAGTVVPEEIAALAIPDASWPSLITETAVSVAAGTATNYERALALQEFLREEGDFEYSEFAPQREGYDDTSAGAVAAFLEVRSGYCVQFASAMAFMARTLGIPSRIALGFLPGEETGQRVSDASRQWVVTSDELHAWPELYFEGIGWVPFEPTTTRGEPADYAEPAALEELDDAPDEAPDVAAPIPSASAPAAPDRGDVGGLGAGPEETRISIPPVVYVLAALLVLALVPAIVRALQRSRRLARVRRGGSAAVAWREVMEFSRDLGLEVASTSTPRENAAVLGSSAGAPRALSALLDALERESYAPAGARAEASVSSEAQSVVSALWRSAPPAQRLAAVLWPRTLVERIIGAIS